MEKLIAAYNKDESLRDQILASKAEAHSDAFDIWWFGQSGFLIQWNGKCLLFDPYLSDSLTRKYAGTQKPHVRMSECVMDPDLLDFVDIVTSSHNHTDHLDGETLIPLLKKNSNLSFVVPEANRDFIAERVQCDRNFPIGLNEGQSATIGDFTFHGIPAAHNELERDEYGQCKYMGYVVEFGGFNIYHSGDTLWFPGLDQLLSQYTLDVAFLPINGNDPSRGVAGNLSAAEAASLGKSVNARYVIPHHYHMFEFNTADPQDFIKEARQKEQPFIILEQGQRATITVR